ncbi:MAG TPA: UvrD-helicase domain-containing protein [Rhabdochlamydiaceae bacterium]|jgi:exodeoxyribonuclease V beta subunit|nr:UvrD-helicase domain-containing protein [Rhabdochlamydiaceae bacterium]
MGSFDILSRDTPLQRRLFLEASAGTGKTFTIEHLVVRLLVETKMTLDQILVVTFTRAATRELKVRIRANLENALSTESKVQTALMNFEKARIFTIHGFCHRLLQEFAFEAYVGLDLQEWEDKDEKWAILEFLRKTEVLSPAQLKRTMGLVRGDIDKLVEKLLTSSESSKSGSCAELLEQANRNLAELSPFSVTEAFNLVRPHYKKMTSEVFDAQAMLLDLALQRGKILPEEWDKLISEEDLFLEQITPSQLKLRTKFTGHASLDQLREALQPALEAARNPRKIFQVLSQAWHEEKKKLSRQQEKLSPDDLLKMVQEKTRDKAFVEEIRKKYCAVIVDEFQDTDPVQWNIFDTLFLKDPEKAVYLVGDPKQSIYGFRNADIYTYLEAAKEFEHKAALMTNYRSTQGLLDALNRLFCKKPWMDLPKLEQELSVPPSVAAKPGAGELCFMIAEGELGRARRWPTPDVEKQFFLYIVHEINQHHLVPSEIAVLIKDRYQALRVKLALESYQIPCVISRGGSLGDSLMVDLLLELIEACHSSDPASSIKKVLLGPFVRLPIEALTDEVVFEAKAVFAQLSEEWLINGFSSFLAQFLKTKFSKTTVFQTLCRKEQEEMHYNDLMQIVEKILYIQDPHQMGKFLKRLKIEELDERISAHPNGVQIMTVHASKGLEFETVFAVGLASRTSAEDKSEAELKELDAEKMRQFYVALTRAKSRLYIPVAREVRGKKYEVGQASPVELFLERAAPDLDTFSCVDLNQITWNLSPYTQAARAALAPPLQKQQFFKPLFLQSFTSLAQTSGERKAVQDTALPSSAETGIIIHAILERYFDQESFLPELIAQAIKGTHLENYAPVIQSMLDRVLDLPLDGFCLRDLDRTRVMPEMEFLFPADGTVLKGFIDLSFEYQGKFYLIDWKTNSLEDYRPQNLHQAMIEHDYLLQGKIYATAFTRYLKLYGTPSFGGVFFLFVRGPAAYHFIPEVFHG